MDRYSQRRSKSIKRQVVLSKGLSAFRLIGYFSIEDYKTIYSIPVFSRKNDYPASTLYRQVPKFPFGFREGKNPVIERFVPISVKITDLNFTPMESSIIKGVGDEIVVVDENIGLDPIVVSSFSRYRQTIADKLAKPNLLSPVHSYELSLLTGDLELRKTCMRRAALAIYKASPTTLSYWRQQQPKELQDQKLEELLGSDQLACLNEATSKSRNVFAKHGFAGSDVRTFATSGTLQALGLFSLNPNVDPNKITIRPITEFEPGLDGTDAVFFATSDLVEDYWGFVSAYLENISKASASVVIVAFEEKLLWTLQKVADYGIANRISGTVDLLVMILKDINTLAGVIESNFTPEQMAASGILFEFDDAIKV